MGWPHNPRLAGALVRFRDQLNAAYPNRSKASDGYIGDAAHQRQGSASDHNPWVTWGGVQIVTAGDFTRDDAAGVNTDRLTDELQASRDNRIKYIIANGYIMSGNGGPSPWVWRRYSGSNPHNTHMHISVHADAARGDDRRAWNIPSFNSGATPPPPPPPPQETPMATEDKILHELLGPRGPNGEIRGWGTERGPRTVVAMLVDIVNELDELRSVKSTVDALRIDVDELIARGDLSADAIKAAVKEAILENVLQVRLDLNAPVVSENPPVGEGETDVQA